MLDRFPASVFALTTDCADAPDSARPLDPNHARGSPDDPPPAPESPSVDEPLFPFEEAVATGAMPAVGLAALTAL
ncbi:MAG: hypothetical protein KBT65_04895 [Sulfitobacter sp.]|nr:hypothetical protein [Sulfitobacter sp.]